MNNNNDFQKRVFKAGFWYVLSQILVRGISFLVTPIYARLLTPEQLGVITIYESWLRVFLPVFTLSLYSSVERAKFDFLEKYDSYISSIQALITMVVCVLGIFIFVFHDFFGELLSMTDMMLLIMLFYLITQAAINCLQRREKVLLNYKANIVLVIFGSVVPTVLSVLILAMLRAGGNQENMVDARILSFYIPQILTGLVVMGIIFLRGKTIVKKDYWRYGLVFSIPLIPHVLSMEILNQSDKIMVQRLSGDYYAGIFSLATKIMWISLLLSQAVGDAWLPWIYEKLNAKEYDDVRVPWNYLIHSFGIFTWVFVMFGPEAIYVMGGKQYMEGVYLVAPLLSSVIAHFFSYSYIAISQFYKKNTQIAIASSTAVVLNIILNYIGILQFGYVAAAYTTAICYFVLILLHGLFLKRSIGTSIVPLKRTMGITMFYYLINVLSIKTYSMNFFLRCGIVIVGAALFMFIFRDLVQAAVNRFVLKRKE